MSINLFYTFSSKLSSSTVQVHATNLKSGEDSNNLSDHYRLILGMYEGISFPVQFKQEYGRKLEDVLHTGWPGLHLISDNVKAVLEENAFSGWQTFAVKILDKKRQEIQGYHGLSVTGRCGKVDFNKSEIIEKRLVPNGPFAKYYKGLQIGLDKWDGSDFFLPEKYFGIIVTSRVADALKKARLSNIRLVNLSELETPAFHLE